ncbi:MAG: redoxin domain-containing protein [Solirubrobacterales bacterium]|nr:redoxin domain-containing protein [Solirubrobacterales bacterium]
MSGRFAWVVGVLGVLGLAVLTIDTLPSDAPGSRGVTVGKPLPPFAVPLATSRRRCRNGPCDANVARKPDSGDQGSRQACEVRARDILNSCELAERGPVALAFVTTRSERCEEQVDVMDRLRDRFPRVRLAVVAVRGDLRRLRETIRRRSWKVPVGYDHDGAVAGAYGVAVCPTITFARRGGRVQATSLEPIGEADLAERLRAIGG